LDALKVGLFKIRSQLKLCREKVTDVNMLEKTYTTFYASNVLLQQQYREHNFTRYFELISFLLVAEQNNELLMKNHHAHPTGSTPFPEANRTLFHGNKGNRGRGRGTLFVDVHIHFHLYDFLAFKTLANSCLGLKDHKFFSHVEDIFQSGASLSSTEINELMIVNQNSSS
jgi:hypothetical protein